MKIGHIQVINLILVSLVFTTTNLAQILDVDGDVIAESLLSPTIKIGSFMGDSVLTTNASIGKLQANKGILVDDDGVQVDGNFITSGWTQLGDSTNTNSPTFKMKQLTGYTVYNPAEDHITSIPHGLDSNKFISVSPVVIYNQLNGNGITENYEYNNGFEFHIFWDATNIFIARDINNSENIINKPVIITIIYIE